MLKCLFALGIAALAASVTVAAPPTADTQIVTGPDRGTYIQIGRDLAKFVAEPAGLKVGVLPSKGSAENVKRLRSEPGVRLALVQSDVYKAFLDEARAGNEDAANLIKPLRVLMPLYAEEIYFVARADSPLNYIHEIKDKRINLGSFGSGTALSGTTIYRQMFGKPISEQNASFMSNEEALLKLATDQSIDVAVVVAGQPAKLFSDMKPEARQYVKLLKLDPQAEETKAASATYAPAVVRSSSYPNWLNEDVSTFTVRALLVTYNFQSATTRESLTRFADSLCSNFARLQSDGHPKWKEVSMKLPPLGKEWSYYAPTERAITTCGDDASIASRAAAADLKAPVRNCPQSKQILGLCLP